MNAALRERRRHRLTVDDYRRMGETGILGPELRVELIDGEIIDMPPIGSVHASRVAQIGRRFERAVGDAAIVWQQNPVLLPDFSAPQPDVALLRPDDGFYESALPTAGDVLLIVEVSDSTLAFDRNVKGPLYAEAGVPEYWRLEVPARRLVLHADPGPDGYRRERTAIDLTRLVPVALPGTELDLSGLV